MARRSEYNPHEKLAYATPRLESLGRLTTVTAAGSGKNNEGLGQGNCVNASFARPCV